MQTPQQAPTQQESRFDFIITESRNARKTTILTRGFDVKNYPTPRIPEANFADFCLAQKEVPSTQKELDKTAKKYAKVCQEYERFCTAFRLSSDANEMAMETNRIMHNVMKKSALTFLNLNYRYEESVSQLSNDIYDNTATYEFQIIDRQNANNVVANWSMSAAEYPTSTKHIPAFYTVWKDSDDADGIRGIIRHYMEINMKDLMSNTDGYNPFHLVSLETSQGRNY